MILTKIKRWFDKSSASYWDRIYRKELAAGELRRAPELMEKVLPALLEKKTILDFGSGSGGNVKLLSQQLSGVHFTLVDQSMAALSYARDNLLGERDDQGNMFSYYHNLSDCPDIYQAIISIQVLEHIPIVDAVIEDLWAKLAPEGMLLVSVPVRGRQDKNREHINKFTLETVLEHLWQFTPWINISARTYSVKHHKLSTAFFMARKLLFAKLD